MRRKYPVLAYHYLRFSSSKQRTGNSVGRQLAWAKKWCEEKGVILDDTLSISDHAVSAFKGKNRTEGGLSNFLAACRQGRVRKGSFLLVESADRLSREHPLDGFSLVKELLSDFGVVIVTAFPAQEFSRANFDRTGWLLQAEFQRAYSESLAKSERSKFNNTTKLERAREPIPAGEERTGDRIVSSNLPAWLTLVGGQVVGGTVVDGQVVGGKRVGGRIVVNKDKAATVRRIFELSSKGYGQRTIMAKMRAEGVQPIGSSKVWQDSSVGRILATRAVLGEYQPTRFVDGRRVPVGEPIKDYYPRIVSDALWAKCREGSRGRVMYRGRVGPSVANLFTGLVWEGEHRMQYRHKNIVGYLQTAAGDSPGILYAPFERAFLWFVRSVEIAEGDGGEYELLKSQVSRLDASIGKLQAQIDSDPDMVDMLPTLSKWRKDRREAAERMEAASVPSQARHLHTRRLVEALATAKGDELETLRREVRQSVRQVVRRIEVTLITRDRPLSPADAERLRIELPEVVPASWRIVWVGVELTTGETHHLVYTSVKGRVIGGVHLHTTDGELVDQIDQTGAFPVDPPAVTKGPTSDELKAKCKAMRAEGKPWKEIVAATGLDRTTAWRYAVDYHRRPRKPAAK